MFIVFRPITAKIRRLKVHYLIATKPQTNSLLQTFLLAVQFLMPDWLFSYNTITFQKYFWCSWFSLFDYQLNDKKIELLKASFIRDFSSELQMWTRLRFIFSLLIFVLIIDLEVPQLIRVLCWGYHSQPVTQVVLLQVLLSEILQVPEVTQK